MWWTGISRGRGAHKIWLVKPERKRPILKLGREGGDNIKMTPEGIPTLA
jgi:hypothetical protein